MKLGRIVIGLKEGDMEYGVETGEIGGKAELVRKVTDRVVDREGTKAAVFELLGRARGLDVSPKKPYELIRLVDGGGSNAFVVVARLGVLSFTKVCTKLFVQSRETMSEVRGSRGRGSDRDAGIKRWVVAEISVEGGGVRGGVGVVVVSELGEREVVDPVVLLRRNVGAEVSLQRLICTFGETVCLRMVHGRKVEARLEEGRELLPERRDECGPAV